MPEFQQATQYWTPGFSPKGDKNRFVLPADFRALVKKGSSDHRILCINRHMDLPCLIGFARDRQNFFKAEVEAEAAEARAAGTPFNSLLRTAVRGGFVDVVFDDSGRFVMPALLGSRARVTDEIYFHGMGNYFFMWAPEVLYEQDAEWEPVMDSCRALQAESRSKDRRK